MSRDAMAQLADIARSYVGVRETGANKGREVEMFQRAVDGKAQGEPYCAGFVFHCIKQADKLMHSKHRLYETEHCLTLWNKSPIHSRLGKPEIGAIIIWQKYDNSGRGTAQGHVGIVSDFVNAGEIKTIEANTNGGMGIEREGDGVYERRRLLRNLDDLGRPLRFRIKGYLAPWE